MVYRMHLHQSPVGGQTETLLILKLKKSASNITFKKPKGFLGINYGTIRFVINLKTNKLISFERI